MIEIIGNDISEFQENEQKVEIEQYGLESFWEWENKLLNQEVDYYENLLRQLKMQIDEELGEKLMTANAHAEASEAAKVMTDDMLLVDEVRLNIENKHATKKNLLI